ncbi:MAG TPA: hypothetical protein PLS48_01125 [Methanotrichaceae archaeon]|nr:hypothetical protein [Methanotrichaceae archaeon]
MGVRAKLFEFKGNLVFGEKVIKLMPENRLLTRLKGESIDVVYTVPVIDRLLEAGEPGVTSGILKDEDSDCIMLEKENGMIEYVMKMAIIRIVPRVRE